MHVQPGDRLNIDDPILTLETEKAAMEIPSPVSGKLIELYVQNGDKINEGYDLCLMEVAETDTEVEEKEKNTEPQKKNETIKKEKSTQITQAQRKPIKS
ncbi:dihydrolipoamide acetyltransferase, partial [Gammaproteobacteria bacterium]|nr:dihydrolipoamide acetyltransferase [Gammaproteobacteria bacterium]